MKSEPQVKLIVGAGDILHQAQDAWRSAAPQLRLEVVEVRQDRAYRFDLGFLDDHSPDDVTVFAAFDDRFLNFKRLELMAIFRLRGYRLPACVSPRAVLAADVQVGENALIGDGVVVGPRSQVDYNAFVAPGCRIGFGCRIGHSSWLETGAIVADRASVGAQTSIGSGVVIGRGVEVGKLCEVRKPGLYTEIVPDKTFYNLNFAEPLRIIN